MSGGVIQLDDPVARWVPAWADRRVRRERHGRLDGTVPAQRDVTVLSRDRPADLGRTDRRAADAHQPGAGWLYQTSYDALTLVLQTATGTGEVCSSRPPRGTGRC